MKEKEEQGAHALPQSAGYVGRLRALLERNDPRMMLVGREEAEQAVQLMSLAAATPGAVDEELLQRARRVIAAAVHPTGFLVPRPLRLAAFPWMNAPLVMGFLAAETAAALVLLQVLNQAFNACFNLANGARGLAGARRWAALRNFTVATAIACAVAVAGHRLEQAVAVKSVWTGLVVPYLSVVSADVVNVAFARWEELTRGVSVTDARGRHLGTSRAAGRAAVAKALLTRSLLLPLVAMLVPTSLMAALRAAPAAGWLFSCAPAAVAAQVACVLLTLAAGLPACAALFPETLRLRVRGLEPAVQLQVRTAAGRRAPDAVYVYRGL